jgi:tetraacyldisaccharide 4'-kinase
VEILHAHNRRAFMLSRGYGSRLAGPVVVDTNLHTAADIGDEAMLLAAAAPSIVARDRRRGAELADSLGADVIVMDDGHQNFSLRKDFSIVAVDGAIGFGNGYVLPAGPLRERVRDGLAHADAVVLVGDGAPVLPGWSGPTFRARLVPRDGPDLAGKRLIAFAGIGRPEKFFETLRILGAHLTGAVAFADHHPFRADEIARLRARAQIEKAMLITTEKDFVRLSPSERDGVAVLRIRAEFEVAREFERLLLSALAIKSA